MARNKNTEPQRRAEIPLERLRTLGDPALRQQTKIVTVFDARMKSWRPSCWM